MRVDEKRLRRVVHRLEEAGEMDFADEIERELGEIGARVGAMIARADEDIVDVEQQSAAGRARDLGEEGGLANFAVG